MKCAREDIDIPGPLSQEDGTMMLLGDAKKMTEEIVKAMDHQEILGPTAVAA
ncbi:MAG: hypothetical protein Q8Q62_05125 [Mesorhizobium sp.]|nr:hypothetical protein [Mesorhizobium sp.]